MSIASRVTALATDIGAEFKKVRTEIVDKTTQNITAKIISGTSLLSSARIRGGREYSDGARAFDWDSTLNRLYVGNQIADVPLGSDNAPGHLILRGQSRLSFWAHDFAAYIDEAFGIRLNGSPTAPVQVINAGLRVGQGSPAGNQTPVGDIVGTRLFEGAKRVGAVYGGRRTLAADFASTAGQIQQVTIVGPVFDRRLGTDANQSYYTGTRGVKVPVGGAGHYLISGSINTLNVSGITTMVLQVVRNGGATEGIAEANQVGNIDARVTATVTIDLADGDEVVMALYSTGSNGTVKGGNDRTWLSATRLGS